ncbi:hypothetical protein [Nitrosococcus wardiae]|uniref:Uncharacterized protein n=1 Tax=Nitrosococcus wardiae TaxID=1814290 RepID=A0A4P7BZU4_9GAMM|nr:hypothetical protein [Nitrosococcus wardiae]QBQ55778.1 hypothetical protein E3U44_15610 [Nitrosococcus wardiae]
MAEHELSQDKILIALTEAGISEKEAGKIVRCLKDETLAVGDSSSLSPEEVKGVLLSAGFDDKAVQELSNAMAEKKISAVAQSVIKILAKILGYKLGVLTGNPAAGIFRLNSQNAFSNMSLGIFKEVGHYRSFFLPLGWVSATCWHCRY